MALCKIAVSPLLMHWRYDSLALRHLSIYSKTGVIAQLASCNMLAVMINIALLVVKIYQKQIHTMWLLVMSHKGVIHFSITQSWWGERCASRSSTVAGLTWLFNLLVITQDSPISSYLIGTVIIFISTYLCHYTDQYTNISILPLPTYWSPHHGSAGFLIPILPQIAKFMGPVGPRWAPSWLHEPCYQGPSPVFQYPPMSSYCSKHVGCSPSSRQFFMAAKPATPPPMTATLCVPSNGFIALDTAKPG